MNRLQFRFNFAKFIQALVFFSKNGVSDLTKLKAAKLLYFADKEHLIRYGRPIIGDVYYALKLGPLPSQADDLLSEAEAAHLAGPSTPEQEEFFRYLDVVSDYWPLFVARNEENFRVFSKSDLDILAEVTKKYGKLDWKRLVDLSHEEPAWEKADKVRKKPNGSALMPYETFFDGESDTTMLQVASAEQEDRELAALIG
jgi:uncharacterized phage-associated protein